MQVIVGFLTLFIVFFGTAGLFGLWLALVFNLFRSLT